MVAVYMLLFNTWSWALCWAC